MRLSLLTAGAAVATVVGAVGNETGFTIAEVQRGFRLKIGILDLAAALRKYGVEPDQNITAAENAALVTGHAPAVPGPYDFEYLAPVRVGHQTLHLDIDTGSSDLWVFSTAQPPAGHRGHTAFKCNAPHVKNAHWRIKYGDGSTASGVVKRAAVTVGGITAPGQSVECAQHVAPRFAKNHAIDGVFGFAFDKLNNVRPRRVNTWFGNVKHKLRHPIFTATLKHNKPGTYDFGYIDARKHRGPIHYAKVNTRRGYWEVGASGYSVGRGKHIGHRFAVVMDTGTSLILTSNAISSNYWRHVRGAQYNSQVGGFIFPCSSKLPNFNIAIGGRKHSVPGHFINYAPAGTISGRRFCYGGIQPNGGVPFTILGDIFLKSQFVVFDTRGPKVGLAPQR